MLDYFDKKHTVHDKVELGDSAETDDIHYELTDVPCTNKEAQQDLDIIKNTPVKMISPKHRKKTTVVQQTTYDQVLSDAMRKLDLCKKTNKPRDTINTQDPKVFKTPSMPIMKLSKSIGCHSVPTKLNSSATTSRSANLTKSARTVKKSDETSVCAEKSSVSCSLFKENKICTRDNDTLNKSDHTVDNPEDNKEGIEKLNEENSEIALNDKSDMLEEESMDDKNNKKEEDNANAVMKKHNRVQSNRQRSATVLTWQNGRRSLNKHRMSNRYVSLAEAVSRFQTDTPKRFRTKSNKDLAEVASHIHQKSLTQSCRMRSTIPISPALMSKNRTRAVTVLRPEEREKLELEEMKKHQIKAKPIPPGVLRGPARPVSKTVAKNLTTTAATTESTSSAAIKRSESASTVTSVRLKSPGTSHHDRTTSSSKNTVTKVLVTDPTGIIVKCEEITFFGVPKATGATKSATRVMPFSFEERNKNLQMKKEQRLKNLQEANKVKIDFHAKPVPNFCKQSLVMPPTAKQQQQQNMKKPSVQQRCCPFSFDKRDKDLSKKKEELVKHALEEDKRSRVFRANPAPVFKPVMIRGISKEHLATKEKVEKVHAVDGRDNQENQEPNTIASKQMTQESKYMRKTKSASHIAVSKRNAASLKGKEQEANAMKTILPLELNTDKRARERRDFDERMKRKEIEEEAKRQEENRKKLELEKRLKAEMRKLAEVKARPMPTYKPLTAVKATKPLTDPQSPAFPSKLRLKETKTMDETSN